MAKIEKVDKWLEADDSAEATGAVAKKKKIPTLADELNLKDRDKKRLRRDRAETMNPITRIQLLLKEAPDNPLFSLSKYPYCNSLLNQHR